MKYEVIMHECKVQSNHQPTLSSKTLASYHDKIVKVFADSVQHSICNNAIGGPGTTVPIDEAKFGKRK